jgi:hypothetical protein
MRTSFEHRTACGWLSASTIALAASACTVVRSAASSSVETRPNTAQATLGPAGGALSTPDAVLTLIVPRAAVDHDIDFTVGPAAAPLPGAIGATFEIGPLGTRFAVPARVSIRYTAAALGDATTADLVVATVVAGKWQALEGGAVDPDASTATGQTPHLSPFALASTRALGGSVSAAGQDGGDCAADDSSSGTCANPARPFCADAPGTVLVACSDQPFGGYVARCCPLASGEGSVDASLPSDASDAEVSDASSDSVAVAPDASDAGAVCVNDSAPTGTCSTPARPLCSAFPGSAVANCANNPGGGGYAALCCPAVDATLPRP